MALDLVVNNTKTEGKPLYCYAEEILENWAEEPHINYVIETYADKRLFRKNYMDILQLIQGIKDAPKDHTLTHKVNPDLRSIDGANCYGDIVTRFEQSYKITYRPLNVIERMELNCCR